MAIDINSLTKRYADPWATSFEYLDPTGMLLGTGYDSYADAIKKLAFTSGLKQYDPIADSYVLNYGGEQPFYELVQGRAGGWGYGPTYNPGAAADFSGEQPTSAIPEYTGGIFGTQEELYNYLLTQPGSPLTYDSREKYGRSLTEGQLQNMYALILNNPEVLNAYKGVPDWEYHRFAYENQYNPTAGINVSGANALVGSTPVFGDDGKIVGYKFNANPEHINGDDTSGRVTSSSHGSTVFDPSLAQYVIPMGDGSIFISADNADKFGYKSYGMSSYNKEDTTFSKLAEMGVKSFLGAGLGVAGGAALSGLGLGGATGGTGMFDGLSDWFSNLFGDGASAADGLSDSFWSDWFSSGGAGADLGSGLTGGVDWLGSGITDGGGITGITADAAISGITGEIPGLGTLTEGGMLIPAAGGAAVPISSLGGSFLNSLYQKAIDDPFGTAAKAYRALQGSGVLSGGLSSIGGYLSGNAAQDAAKTNAQAQIEAARIAADAAKFKPVGVTTRFGQSQFIKDANGNVVSAGYNLTPDIKAMQDSLIGSAPGMLSQFTDSRTATAPMGEAAQRMMQLGNGYLSTDPQAQAQKYYDDQQAIMAAGRARDQAGALTGEFNRGTYGLATGATGMMGAANPRLEAMYNAQRQQDLQAAANATQGGMDYAKFGSTMTGLGGTMLRDMYGTQTAAYNPYATAMTGAQNIEGLGQNALDLAVNMGKVASPAESGRLLGQGMLGAANTMQQANQYSPWGTALMNAGNALNTMQQPQQQQTSGYTFNPFTGVRL